MIVISVLYPSDGPLDMDYYRLKHLPLVRRLLEPMGMLSLAYITPDQPSIYQLVAELRFADRRMADMALAAHGSETQADIASFTGVSPIILIGHEVQA